MRFGGGFIIKLWDTKTGAVKRKLAQQLEQQQIGAIAFSPDGSLIATGSPNALWETTTGKLKGEFGSVTSEMCEVEIVAFSPDGNTLATGSADNTLRIWDLRAISRAHSLSASMP